MKPRVLWFGPRFLAEQPWEDFEIVCVGVDPGCDIRVSWQMLFFLEPLVREVRADLVHVECAHGFRIADVHRLGVPCLYSIWDPKIYWKQERFYLPLFDAVFVSQKACVDAAAAIGVQSVWLPFYANRTPEECVPPGPSSRRSIDVSFVGSFISPYRFDEERYDFLSELADRLPQDVSIFFGRGDWQTIYPKSKIVLNHAVQGEVNLRLFEAMASGAVALNPDCGVGLRELVRPGREAVLYRNESPAAAAASILHLLNHEHLRREIAEAGFIRARAEHLRCHRRDVWARTALSALSRRAPPLAEADATVHLCASLISTAFFREFPVLDDQVQAFEAMSNLFLQYALTECERIGSSSPRYADARVLMGLSAAVRGDMAASSVFLEQADKASAKYDGIGRILTRSGGGRRPLAVKSPLPRWTRGRLALLVRRAQDIIQSGIGVVAFRVQEMKQTERFVGNVKQSFVRRAERSERSGQAAGVAG